MPATKKTAAELAIELKAADAAYQQALGAMIPGDPASCGAMTQALAAWNAANKAYNKQKKVEFKKSFVSSVGKA